MDIHLIDWILVAILSLVVPVAAVVSIRRIRRDLATGDTGARLRFFRGTIVEEWVFLGVVLAVWLGSGRTPASLGLTVESTTGFLVASGLTALAVAGLALQARHLPGNAEGLALVRRQMESVSDLMPRTRRELMTFHALSVTAGVVEEIVYRGYLMAFFGTLAGPWGAVLGSMLVFSAGHAYQPATIHRVAAIGLVTSLLYLLSGSVLPIIVLHAVIDMTSGHLAYAAFHGDDETATGDSVIARGDS